MTWASVNILSDSRVCATEDYQLGLVNTLFRTCHRNGGNNSLRVRPLYNFQVLKTTISLERRSLQHVFTTLNLLGAVQNLRFTIKA